MTEVWMNEVPAALSPESMDMLAVRVFSGISNELYDLYTVFKMITIARIQNN
jgi:hypothetical protein